MNRKLNTIFWVERMSMPDVLSFMIRGMSVYRVYYDENKTSKSGRKCIELLNKAGFLKNFHQGKLNMAEKDGTGFSVRQDLLQTLQQCIEDFLDVHLKTEPERIRQMVRSYMAHYVHDKNVFLVMAIRSSFNQFTGNRFRNIFFVSRHPFNHVLRRHYIAQKGVDIREYGFMDSIKFYLTPYIRLAAVLFFKLLPGNCEGEVLGKKPAIWIEYPPIDFVDFSFWSSHVNKDNLEIVYYLDRSDDGDVNYVASRIKARGFKWLRLYFPQLSKLGSINITRLFQKTIFSGKFLPYWLKMFNMEYNLHEMLYASVFGNFNVKVLIQHQEALWKQEAQASAIASVGGIMVGFNWSSYYLHPVPTHIFPQHVYFVWGEEAKRYIEMIGKPQYILPSGLWTMRYDKRAHELSGLAKNLKFIVALFDSTAAYNIHQSPDMLSRFYLCVLDMVKDNSEWGCIIKGKNYDMERIRNFPRGDEILSKIDSLTAVKRLAVLNRNYNALAASEEADISVGFGFNTAGIISAIHGFRAICWDCAGVMERIENKDYYKNVAYSSLDELLHALKCASIGDRTIGDFSKWRQKFNYFDDILAPQRVGRFFQTFMDEIIKTNEVNHSLIFSVKKYKVENGLIDNKMEEYRVYRSLCK